MTRNDPLTFWIKDGVLTICIGVEVIAKAVELDPELTEYDDKTGEWIEPKITDVDKFAADVMNELRSESEDGTTLIHTALDTAAMNAIENGCESVRLPKD